MVLTGATLLSGPVFQAGFVLLLVVAAVLLGRETYRYAAALERRVHERVRDRKRPKLRYMLYDILWRPMFLVVIAIVLRIGMVILPPGDALHAVAVVFESLLLVSFFWFAVRVVKKVTVFAMDQA